jgi:hypothetical protein
VAGGPAGADHDLRRRHRPREAVAPLAVRC